MVDRSSVARAQSRIAELKGFYTHLFIYAAVVAGLFLINAATSDPWWAQWVLFGWGIGVAAHAIAMFWRTPSFVREWERRKLRRLVGRSQ